VFSKAPSLERIERGRALLKTIEEMLVENTVDKDLFVLIKEKLYCFGPSRTGPNLLLIRDLNPQRSLYEMYSSDSVETFEKR
jgi:hypothetical protein